MARKKTTGTPRTHAASVTVGDVTAVMDRIAPPHLAESWDNVGLLVGVSTADVSRCILCIDLTEDVLAEAVEQQAQMIVSYHPLIFDGMKCLRPDVFPGSIVMELVRRGMAVYSPHTALDCAPGGTCDILADMVDMVDPKPIRPTSPGNSGHCKLVVFVPESDLDAVSNAVWSAGGGLIGEYRKCSFRLAGTGTFEGSEHSNPTVGQAQQFEQAPEYRLEILVPTDRLTEAVAAMRAAHSYEEPAYEMYHLAQEAPARTGMGRIGNLARPVSMKTLVAKVKRHTGIAKLSMVNYAPDRVISSAAVCPGSCGKILYDCIGRCDAYITGEMRHHDALAAQRAGLAVICTSHSNSERLALNAIARRLAKDLPSLDAVVSERDRDPFHIA